MICLLEEGSWLLHFGGGFVLGCFFGLGFAAFSGCGFMRRYSVWKGWFWRCFRLLAIN